MKFLLLLCLFPFVCYAQEQPQTTPLGEEIGNLQFNRQLVLKNNFYSGLQLKIQPENTTGADTLSLPFADDFSSGTYNMWTDSFAYLNSSFAIDPPTIAVATLDGVNQYGEPYDFSSPTTYGNADKLTSKPIDLSNLTADSAVVLSFYYQPQGKGDSPETIDSLALEFYSPVDSSWNTIWSMRGQTDAEALQTPVFLQQKLSITDSKFLQKGFQFRFRNKATLSGMFDLWNIDYVYLDKNRNITDNSIPDFAFVSIGNSFTNTYTSMRMKEFKGNQGTYMTQNFSVKMTNMSSSQASSDSNRFFVFLRDTLRKESVSIQQSFAPQSQQNITHLVLSAPAPNNYYFLETEVDSPQVAYKIQFTTEQTGIANELLSSNDTVTHFQIFDSYYSYDDGSAEKTYSITPDVNISPSLAYKFSTVLSDSLKGVYVNFPKFLDDYSQLLFKLTVWNNNGGVPGSILYEGAPVGPVYATNSEFIRYKINPPLPVSGTYYVGFQQNTPTTQNEKIRIGFDKNINNQSKIFFNKGNGWNNASVPGSLLIRPDFGEEEIPAAVAYTNENEPDFEIFPNPNEGSFTIEFGHQLLVISHQPSVKIYNILGELVYRQPANTSRQRVTTNLPNGLYFIQIQNGYNTYPLKKLVIAK